MRELKLSNPPTIHEPLGYSHVAEIANGKLIYIAGQVALDADGALVGKEVQLSVVRTIRDGFVNKEAPPVSTFVVVRRLARPDWLIEVEGVAFLA
jgi:enamine deaminase RidA (YjgF/YER057c/UK114 family)